MIVSREYRPLRESRRCDRRLGKAFPADRRAEWELDTLAWVNRFHRRRGGVMDGHDRAFRQYDATVEND